MLPIVVAAITTCLSLAGLGYYLLALWSARAFQRQSRDFAAAVKAAGKPVELLVGEGYNHFEMLETLANPYGLLGRAVMAQMGLMKD